jgi:flagellar hook-length control protein FliK
MSEGDGATTDGATTVATSPAAGAPTTTGTSPGQGPAGASDPSADAFSGAGPAGGRTTTAPPGHERPAAPSAAPPSPAPSGTPDAEHVVRLSELAHAARATVRRSGPSSMRVQLHPAELGTVEVEVRLDDDGLQMVLRAERHHGAERLASNLDQLRRGLEREGLQLTDIEVSVGTSDRDTDLRGDTAPRDADDDPARSDEDAVDRTNPSTGARRRGSVTHRSEHRLTIEL